MGAPPPAPPLLALLLSMAGADDQAACARLIYGQWTGQYGSQRAGNGTLGLSSATCRACGSLGTCPTDSGRHGFFTAVGGTTLRSCGHVGGPTSTLALPGPHSLSVTVRFCNDVPSWRLLLIIVLPSVAVACCLVACLVVYLRRRARARAAAAAGASASAPSAAAVWPQAPQLQLPLPGHVVGVPVAAAGRPLEWAPAAGAAGGGGGRGGDRPAEAKDEP